MKKVASIAILFFALAILLTACNTESEKKDSAPKKISIVATIYPQYDWIKNILGERINDVDLKLLIKNGTDLHSYKPSAQDIATIAKADLVVYVGGESDEWIEKALAATPKDGRIALNLMKALGDHVKKEEIVEGMQAEEEHHEHAKVTEPVEATSEHHHHEEVENDEHIWLSLKNAWILVNALAQSLSKVDSANSSIYTANAILYNAKLWEMDKEFATATSDASQKTVLFGDRFPFLYLTKEYGLTYYAAFAGCEAETEASFKTIRFLAHKLDQLGLPAVCTIEGSDQRLAETIISNTGAGDQKILTLNSMQAVTADDAKAGQTWLGIMEENLSVLQEALQ